MAVHKIVVIDEPGAEVLRQKAEPVTQITNKVRKLIKDMVETMYVADGAGLAAPQIGVSKQIAVIDVGEGPICLINPEIVHSEGEEIDVEGCLSIPGLRAYVKRSTSVIVKALDEKGRPIRVTGDGLLARALQHEIDHLNGVLMTDRMIDVVPQEEVQQEAGE
ncbi:MAG TPA: peptide deformylase [Firmicutes bacterium]|jgi:peptide deformylase|nr:MAG: peptide deformylase [Peptococcaceae bacterium 1109]HHT74349.1 peptide deformylase [Bacillota bacterium]